MQSWRLDRSTRLLQWHIIRYWKRRPFRSTLFPYTTALKPDPAGWRIIAEHFGARLDARAASADTATRFAGTRDAVVVGDSWVDGVAAAAVGVPFVAYGAREADLTRHGVTPVAWLSDLARLPEWLTAHFGFQGSPRRSNRLGSHCHDGLGRPWWTASTRRRGRRRSLRRPRHCPTGS